eukprot:c34193_g1_i1 orf=348-1244(-)
MEKNQACHRRTLPHSFLSLFSLAFPLLVHSASQNFFENFFVNWGESNVQIDSGGRSVRLALNKDSGSGFASRHRYLFGSISTEIKLVPGNSAGTVTAYYMSSESTLRDEIDFEFLGNLSGQPYILQTNVFASGTGNREQRIYLWFDPTADYHTYSILWNKQIIVLLVDSMPIRAFQNNEVYGVPYPTSQPMTLMSSVWNGDDWATRGGLVKIDWTAAPFVASYRSFQTDACVWESSASSSSSCGIPDGERWWNEVEYKSLSPEQRTKLKWVKDNYLVYDYCADKVRFGTPPLECAHNP